MPVTASETDEPRSARASGPRARSFALALGLVVAGSLALDLYQTTALPLTDPDEGRYAEIARAMAESGDWIVPRLFGLPYLEKPPLLYWMTAIAFRTLGVGELSARLPSALAGVAGVAAVALFARAWFGARAALLGAAVLATSAMYFAIARAAITDMLFAVALASALLTFFHARERGGRAAPLLWPFALAAAVLSKGPAAVVLFAAVIAVDLALERARWRALLRARLWAGLPLFVAVAAPWFVVISLRFPDYPRFYVLKEHLHRVMGAEHAQPIYWFVPLLLGGLLPWTPFAIVAARRWLREATVRSDEGRAVRFLLVAAGVVFAIFSLSSGKLAPYVLPVLPPLAILIGRALERAMYDPDAAARRAWVACAGLLLLVAAALIAHRALTAWVLPSAPFVLPFTPFALLVAVLVGGSLLVLRHARGAGDRPVVALLVTTIGAYLALARLAPAVIDQLTASPFIRTVAGSIGRDDEVAIFGAYFPSAAFYLRRRPYLVGVRNELRFGAAADPAEASTFLLLDRRALARVAPHGRLFILTDDRAKRARELHEAADTIREIGRNASAALWLRPPPGVPQGGADTAALGR